MSTKGAGPTEAQNRQISIEFLQAPELILNKAPKGKKEEDIKTEEESMFACAG